jgi:hypothetical protein
MSSPSPAAPHSPETVSSPAAIARIRALSRPGFDPRRFATSISPIEIAAVVVLLVTAVAVVLVYSYSVLPGQVRISQLSSTHSENAKKIDDLRAKVHDPGSVRVQFDQAVASLERFRQDILKPRLSGRVAILKDVDRLTHTAGVTLLGGVEFTSKVVDTAEAAGASGDANGRDSRRSRERSRSQGRSKGGTAASYSSLNFSLSVAGRYDKLRKFIGEFEASPQFVVINSVTLVPADQPSDSKNRRGDAASGPTDTLTLKINVTAYFQPQVGWDASEGIAASDTTSAGA